MKKSRFSNVFQKLNQGPELEPEFVDCSNIREQFRQLLDPRPVSLMRILLMVEDYRSWTEELESKYVPE